MDWDPADVVAALRKAGWSLRQLSLAHGYRTNALKHALRRPYPRAERIIASALDRSPEEIWPSRCGSSRESTCTHGDNGAKDTTLREGANAGGDESE